MHARTTTDAGRSRRRKWVAAALIVGSVGALSGSTALAAHTNSSATLGASQTGDADGTGSVVLSFDNTLGEVCSTLTTSNIAAPTMAHIHRGVAGSAGPVVVPLSIEAGEQCASADVALVNEITASPSDFYVNVHNADFPNGAIRAQVADLTDSTEQSTRFALAGSESVDPASGDPTSTGSVDLRVDSTDGEVCFVITEDTAEPLTLGHIHTGAAGTNGDILIGLGVTEGNTDGCVTTTPANVDAIVADPGGHYLNLHTAANPSGVMRGQLGAFAPLKTSTTALDGKGFGDPDGSGQAAFTFYPNGDVCYSLTTTGIDDATMAHIHTGADGVQGPVLIGLEFTGTSGSKCVTTTPENVAAIQADPTGFYVNVHNPTYPDGAIRAQLGPITDAPATTVFDGIALVATGDSNGSGTARLDIDPATGRVCFTITTTNIAAVTVAHIHAGAADVDGPVVVDFDIANNADLDGCVFTTAEQAAAIVANPGAFYVNVHTAEAPMGAIRAQVDGTAPATPTTTTVAPAPVAELPATGNTDTTPLALIALALLGSGIAIIATTRRRSPLDI